MTRAITRALMMSLALAAAGRAEPALHSARGLELDPMQAAALEGAVAGAARRLARPECRRIFLEFHDAAGTPLQEHLEALGLAPAEYLRHVVFVDGRGRRTCRRGEVIAVTAPGSRVVYVCGRAFHELAARDRVRAEIVVLHETLHTLGLGEDPPTSLEITRRVAERCGGD